MKKVLIGIGILIACFGIGFLYLASKPSVASNYTEVVETGGAVEKKYLGQGNYDVSYLEINALQNFKKYELYYPTNIETETRKFPVVIFSNGTGVRASKYASVLKHLASWGFIVIGTEEEYSWNGFSSEMSLRLAIKLNDNKTVEGLKSNPFFSKVDLDKIGLSGHSQGGVGVFNAVTEQKHGHMIKTIYAASPANLELSSNLEWDYDPSLISVPTFLVSGTGGGYEDLVVSGKQLTQIYETLPATITKVMARRKEAGHGDMLRLPNGYMVAWFMWRGGGGAEAETAFQGNSPEIVQNKLYQDQRIMN
ncbi:lipase [Streptococcus suis A7]|uniref:poly(ethylene terephthalate) hydrolase family protein n=1 Tax=Streptococcus suis TaxID=1307 RepID=UPI0002322DF9|nr:lipase [Streptococcus suis]AER43637.1 lipase [Streptococcus suis A7]